MAGQSALQPDEARLEHNKFFLNGSTRQLQIYVKGSVTGAARSGLSIETENDEVSVRRGTKYTRSMPYLVAIMITVSSYFVLR